jgi:drug/metabolite transporter (DMT)-like permease
MNEQPPAEISAAPSRAPGPAGRRSYILVGYACAALGAALFSTKAIIIKLAYAEAVNTETLLALRMLFSLPVYLAIGLLSVRDSSRGETILPSVGMALRAAVVGALGYWLASYLDFFGLVFIAAAFERLILFTYPAFVVLFGALFFDQSVRARALVGIGISYAGLLLIFLTKINALGTDVAKGAGLVLGAAIGFALYQLLAKNLILAMGPRLFTCIAMSGASIGALLQFFLTQPPDNLLVSRTVLILSVVLAIGATVLPTFLLNAALHRISAQANATIGTLSPVVTIVLGVLVLGEAFTATDAVGAALVLAGVGWFTVAERRR